jgi:hypothetical protein
MFAEDIFERSDMPFFVWGDTLDHIVKNEEELTGDTQITLAVKRAEWVKEHVSILEHWGGQIFWMGNHQYKLRGPHDIPIVIHIIMKEYSFLKHPDTRHYWVEEFNVPNPLSTFYKQRASIT